MKFKDIIEEAIKFSKMEKLGKIPTWDLRAGLTCPASKCKTTGEIKPSCKSCYAKRGHFNYPSAKRVRDENQKDWKRSDWAQDMVDELGDLGRFRWLSSGDVYAPALAEKIYQVMKKTPHVTHWLPTMSHTIPKIAVWIDKMDKLKNVRVRRSAGSTTGEFDPKTHGSTIVDAKTLKKWEKEGLPKGIELCPVGIEEDPEQKKGKRKHCKKCRKCFDPKHKKVIAYIKH